MANECEERVQVEFRHVVDETESPKIVARVSGKRNNYEILCTITRAVPPEALRNP